MVCFILAKFSHATVSADYNAPINWIHLYGQGDLIAIFEKSTLSASHIHEALQLKVHQHQKLLVRFNCTLGRHASLTDTFTLGGCRSKILS